MPLKLQAAKGAPRPGARSVPRDRQRASQSIVRRQAIADANDVFELSQKRYLDGAIDYFDVVDAQRSLLSAELSNVQTLNARFAATIALIRATGGGL